MLVFGLFMGVGVPAVINAALHNVTEQDSGLASDIRTTAQRVGSALGPGRLATLALRHGAGQILDGAAENVALTHGYMLSFRIGAALLVVGALPVCSCWSTSPMSGPHRRSDRSTGRTTQSNIKEGDET
jgi:hypothetical protein